MAFDAQNRGNLKRYVPLLVVGIAIMAGGVGLFAGRSMILHRTESPQDKIDAALRDFRSGYDEAALSLLKPLADEGNPKAEYWLADIYRNGYGVKPDFEVERGLLEKSAAQGFVPAERRLGELYLSGTETLQDFTKAQSWLHTAAIAGDATAQRELGQMLGLGMGMAVDIPQAYGWYENAVINGDGIARRLRDALVITMSPQDLKLGQQAAKDIAASVKASKK